MRHGIFGEGIVVSCTPLRDDTQVEVIFKGVGQKKLLLSFAKLERVES